MEGKKKKEINSYIQTFRSILLPTAPTITEETVLHKVVTSLLRGVLWYNQSFFTLVQSFTMPHFSGIFLPKFNPNSTLTQYAVWGWAFPHHSDHCGLLKRIFNFLEKYYRYVSFLPFYLCLSICIHTHAYIQKSNTFKMFPMKKAVSVFICALL